jgi:hypothetical protein
MPDWTGIGTGIGQGMQNVAEGLWRREELRRSDREKQAEELHKKGLQIIDNIVQRGYRISHDQDKKPILLDAQGQPAANAPQDVQDLFSQATATSKQLTGLYPAHESGALLQQFRKFLGKPPTPATPDPRAEEYGVERMQAEVPPIPEPKYTGEMGEWMQAMKVLTDPRATPEQKQGAQLIVDEMKKPKDDWIETGEAKLDRTTGRYYQTYRSKSDPGKQITRPMPMDFQPKGTEKTEAAKPSDEEVRAAATLWAESGVRPPTRLMGPASQYMVEHQLRPMGRPDTSPTGRYAKALLDSGKVKDPQQAQSMAAAWYVKVQQAKEKAASGGGSNLTLAEATALAQMDIILGRTTAFGLGKSQDRDVYNRAKADLMMTGGLGEAMGIKGDVASRTRALGTLANQRGQIGAFEKTLGANLDQVLLRSAQVGRTGSRLANEYTQYLQGNLTDYPELAQFRVAVNTAANEYARVVNSATGGAVTTDTARGEAMSLLNTAMAEGSLEGAVQQMKIDANNRIVGMDSTIDELRNSLRDLGGGGAAPNKEDLRKKYQY